MFVVVLHAFLVVFSEPVVAFQRCAADKSPRLVFHAQAPLTSLAMRVIASFGVGSVFVCSLIDPFLIVSLQV